MTLASLITIGNVFLAFMAGVYFSKWMGDRRRRRLWYRENHR